MQIIYKVKGMHCRSCEILIEDEVKKIKGVQKVIASTKKAEVLVSGNSFSEIEAKKAIKKAGYEIGEEILPTVNLKLDVVKDLAVAFLIVTLLYLFGSLLGIERIVNPGKSSASNLGTVFFIGLTAGLSTCMALVGGLVLAISTRFIEKHPNSSTVERFRPHIYFNLERIVSYFVLGGLIGYLGQTLRFSNNVLGILMLFVSAVMIALGIQLINVFPKLKSFFILPKSVSLILNLNKKTNGTYSDSNALILGAMTFFLPCGFTQAMQIYAVTTGSFLRGALVMGVFAVGTTPGLLSIGGITAIIKKQRIKEIFFKIVGMVVILLALYNISNGLNLINFNKIEKKPAGQKETWKLVPPNKDSVQIISATYEPVHILSPKEFRVKAGQPVSLQILAMEDGQGCMGSVMIPGLVDEPQFFQKDQTITFDFTPPKPGKYWVTCAMGLRAALIIAE